MTTRIDFQARLRPARREELAALRARRAQDEAARRAAAEQAETARQLDDGRAQLRQLAGQLHAQLRAYRDAVPPDQRAALDDLGQAVKAVVREAREAADAATLCALEARLSRNGHEVVAALLRAAPLPEVPPDLAAAHRLLIVDPALRERFDPGGDQAALQALDQARRSQDPAARAPAVAAARALAEAHLQRLRDRYQTWEQARAEALVAQAALLSRLAGLHADEAAVTFCAAKLQAASNICDRIGQMLAAERWDEAAAIARSAQPLCDAVLARAEERQLAEEQRASLVTGLLEGLRGQDLTVLDPELAQPGDLESGVVLRVHRAVRPLTVTIHPDGRVSYQSAASDPTLWLIAHKAHHTVADAYGFDLDPAGA